MIKVSITRALAEVKLLEKKLAKKGDTELVELKKGKSALLTYNSRVPIDQFLSDTKGVVESYEALFRNKLAYKEAIARANATVKVELEGEEMTIIKAIAYKESASNLVAVYESLINQFNKAEAKIQKNEVDIENKVEEQLKIINSKPNGSTKAGARTELLEEYQRTSSLEVVSNYSYTDLVNRRDVLLAKLANVDIVLSEANSRTEIEVDI